MSKSELPRWICTIGTGSRDPVLRPTGTEWWLRCTLTPIRLKVSCLDAAYSIDAPAEDLSTPRYETLDIEGRPLRLLSAEVMVAGSSYTVQLAAPLSEAYDILHRLQWLLVARIPVVLVLASTGGYWMSRA